MQTSQQILIHQQLSNIIFEGVFPTKTVSILNVPFEFVLTDQIIPQTKIKEQVSFFSKIISCFGCPGTDFIENLPFVLFYSIANKYVDFQTAWIPKLTKELYEFTQSNQSRGYWLLYKGSKGQYSLPTVNNKLNLFQKYWIIFNQSLDKKDNLDLIANIFESLQPWLDKELFAQIKQEENSRENVFFDDDKIDAELQEKAKKIAKQKINKVSEDDLDTITLG